MHLSSVSGSAAGVVSVIPRQESNHDPAAGHSGSLSLRPGLERAPTRLRAAASGRSSSGGGSGSSGDGTFEPGFSGGAAAASGAAVAGAAAAAGGSRGRSGNASAGGMPPPAAGGVKSVNAFGRKVTHAWASSVGDTTGGPAAASPSGGGEQQQQQHAWSSSGGSKAEAAGKLGGSWREGGGARAGRGLRRGQGMISTESGQARGAGGGGVPGQRAEGSGITDGDGNQSLGMRAQDAPRTLLASASGRLPVLAGLSGISGTRHGRLSASLPRNGGGGGGGQRIEPELLEVRRRDRPVEQ